MAYKVLSLDGGGVAGLYTACVIDRLTALYPGLLSGCNLIAGTSTGGIIALCLAHGIAPARIADLYDEASPEIFDDSFWDDIRDLGKAAGADYSNKSLKKFLERTLGADTRLKDLSTRVLVPAFDLDTHDVWSLRGDDAANVPRTWKPKFFHNFPGKDSDADEFVVDVALRTSAAPTYFPSHQGYIDGGVVANNPSMAGLATALDSRCGRQSLDNVVLLSISAGSDQSYLKGEKLDWGWGQWARPLISIMMSGVMGVADFQCRQLLDDRYKRVDRVFDRAVKLDDASRSTRAYLRAQAAAIPLDGVAQWLRRVWI